MLSIRQLEIGAGKFRLANIELEIDAGEYGVLMGYSGCGKTTLLETICGLIKPLSGEIHISNRKANGLKPAERSIGYVPQSGELFGNMTVSRHLGFALKIRKWDKTRRQDRIHQLAKELNLHHLLDRSPHGLSGGERQRVALGRALSYYPKILLLDEPLSALDEPLRKEMIELLKTITREYKCAALHVTHSPWEAKQLADRLYEIKENSFVRVH